MMDHCCYTFSKDKALYKSCGEAVDGGKTCQKKVMEQGENQYRCEKCQVTKSTFTWRMILQVNMADTSDNVWATCFQVMITACIPIPPPSFISTFVTGLGREDSWR